jgi:ADP-heptose:LPS heptosyltransferase
MSRLQQRLYVLGQLALQGLSPWTWRRRADRSPRRILVLHHLLLGDTLMLTPLLAKLAEQCPDAERFLACPEPFVPLYAKRPFGVQALAWNARRENGLAALRQHGPYDWVIIPAENRLSPLARALGAHWITAFADDLPAWKNWLIDDARPFPSAAAAFGDFCAELVPGPAPQTYAPASWPMPEGLAFSGPEAPYAILHLGASTSLKFWPAERWMQLAQMLLKQGITPVWSAGAKEQELVQAADPHGLFTSYAGKLDLVQLALLFRKARLIVCPDTGITHLARIVGTPTVALFGPGSSLISGAGKYWGKSPFIALSADVVCRNQDVTFRRHAAWIRRCARTPGTGPDQCARAICMEGITPESVAQACMGLLEAPESDGFAFNT